MTHWDEGDRKSCPFLGTIDRKRREGKQDVLPLLTVLPEAQLLLLVGDEGGGGAGDGGHRGPDEAGDQALRGGICGWGVLC